ncbi:hypothetical protein [Subtercola lobariae]|uniref:Uncharacterized protein n=1 Tax=Subtercola lobariae TaxID=1588641 RepID=A0A917B3K5_9MICO|nr:hypothetical protein [Subtercola lobariae]GGF21068.1 hypothetical protein GCM10011399_13380 [Subtercola lobariae]
MRATDERFTGRIAGFGTASGVRIVIGMWSASPFARFADVMVEEVDGRRLLIAPTPAVAAYVSSTYSFDAVELADVHLSHSRAPEAEHTVRVTAGSLEVTLHVGAITPLGRLLRAVPARLAVSPAWLRAIDPVAGMLVPGVHTSGSAGGGRREYYGVTTIRAVTSVTAVWDGRDLGALRPLEPPVTFGFGSAPSAPSLVDLTTVIRSSSTVHG